MSSSSSGVGWRIEDEDEDEANDGFTADENDNDDDYIGEFISDVAGAEGGDDNWNDLCGACCSSKNKDVVEDMDVEMDEEAEHQPLAFEGQTLDFEKLKKRRVVKKCSVTTTKGAPKVLSPGDVRLLYNTMRFNSILGNNCCARASSRRANCIEHAFTSNETMSEDVAGGMIFLTGCREESLNMTKSEKKELVQTRLRGLWNGALTARAAGDDRTPQYFPYGAMHMGRQPITLCKTSFAALYDVTPHLVKTLVTNIMSGLPDVNPDKKHDYGNRTTFDHVTYGDIKSIFEDEGNIPIGTTRQQLIILLCLNIFNFAPLYSSTA
jgi:hypothetical protein